MPFPNAHGRLRSRSQHDDQRNEKDLETDGEYQQRAEHFGMLFGSVNEQSADDADHRKGEKMDDRIFHHERPCRSRHRRLPYPVKERGGEHRRRFERMALSRVEDKEPDSNNQSAEEARDRAIHDDSGSRLSHSSPPRFRPSGTWAKESAIAKRR